MSLLEKIVDATSSFDGKGFVETRNLINLKNNILINV